MILDEPAAALDPRAERELFEDIRSVFAGRSVLLVSHRLADVVSADRTYVLAEGRTVEQGGRHELMAVGGRYAELFTMQASSSLDAQWPRRACPRSAPRPPRPRDRPVVRRGSTGCTASGCARRRR